MVQVAPGLAVTLTCPVLPRATGDFTKVKATRPGVGVSGGGVGAGVRVGDGEELAVGERVAEGADAGVATVACGTASTPPSRGPVDTSGVAVVPAHAEEIAAAMRITKPLALPTR
jgi:hypothetical protein